MHTCMHAYIHVYTYIHAYIHAYMHTYRHAAEERLFGSDARRTCLTRERLRIVQGLLASGEGDMDDDGDETEEGTICAVLLQLYVAPASRRQGTARRALPLLVQIAWRLGAESIVAAVSRAGSGAATSLLRARGFVNVTHLDEARQAHGAVAPVAPARVGGLSRSHVRLHLARGAAKTQELRQEPL